MFISESANLPSRDQLNLAIALEAEGKTEKEIFEKTKWFRFKEGDGRWRLETDDSSLEFTDEFLKSFNSGKFPEKPFALHEVFKPNQILDLYPQFWNTIISPLKEQDKTVSGTDLVRGGSMFKNEDGSYELKINFERDLDYCKNSILHETQHVIQKIEGLSVGGNATLFTTYESQIEERIENSETAANILKDNPEYADAIKSLNYKFIDLHNYSDTGDLDWDLIPDDVADKYFEEQDMVAERFPHEDSLYENAFDEIKYPSSENRVVSAHDQALYLAGEVEAHLVGDRSHLTKDERELSVPIFTSKSRDFRLKINHETDSSKLMERAWIDKSERMTPIRVDTSVYSDDYFTKIATTKRADMIDIMKAVTGSYLVMISDITKNLPDDNPLVIDFKKITGWLDVSPNQFRNMDYISRGSLEEKFYEGLVNYMSEPTPKHNLRSVFHNVTDWIRRLTNKIESKIYKIDVSDDMKGVYENIFGNGPETLRETSFSEKLRKSLSENTNLLMDQQILVTSMMEIGYENIASRAGLSKDDVAEKYSMEFNRIKVRPMPKSMLSN